MKKRIKILLVFFICIAMAISVFATAVQLEIIEFNLFTTLGIKEESKDNILNETPIIVNNPPLADFVYTNDLYTVTFTDKSTDKDNDILTYYWDFGDGTTSTEKNLIHIYDCSETNFFDITLTVSDGEFSDTHTDDVLFVSHLNIIDYSQIWIGYNSYEEWGIYEPVWIGYITMTIENTGNIPAEIFRATIKSKEGDYPILYSEFYFNFTYTYEEVVDGGDEGNGFSSEIVFTFISNNTLTLQPSKTITLTSNPDLTYVMWGIGVYPVNIWLFERIQGKDTSHTLYETVIELE